ncbi:MAG: DUF4920 domain-containing protein [Phycisphaerales bacterium]|nr:DUF4920 domain-containing protein [Phycisphaerae bacterium]NNF43910.1 DUF4920 domain-containing protein [Phycisphaerales bacterium]NNM27251.1 DUF4920 domain-containing protein [Phycisphaerales bacterium]
MLATLVSCQGVSPMQSAREAGWQHYGGEGDGTPVALGVIDGTERNVVVTGTIDSVCPKKGCWMRVREGDGELFVRFRDYGFFVPRNAAGHEVVMFGTPSVKIASVEELRHYAEDAGRSPEEIAVITEPERQITFMADSVFIDGTGLEEPHSQ